jgi:hypothetical protein
VAQGSWRTKSPSITPSASTAATSTITQPPKNLKLLHETDQAPNRPNLVSDGIEKREPRRDNTKFVCESISCSKLTFFDRSIGKALAAELHHVGFYGKHSHAFSQARNLPPTIIPSASTAQNDQLEDIPERTLGGEIGMDEDDELLTAVRQTSEAAKKNHKSGTKGVS